MLRWFCVLVLFIILSSYLFTLIVSGTFFDILFISSLILLTIGGIMVIIQGKAFVRFKDNFVHFWKSSKSEEIIKEIERRGKYDSAKNFYKGRITSLTKVITFSGLFLILCSIILAFIYY